MTSARTCPYCSGRDTTYQMFSGGREMYCRTCDATYLIPDDANDAPRAALLQTAEGRITLRALVDQELARRRRRRLKR